jgi:hypothetical protein
MGKAADPAAERPDALGAIRAVILCGGMGKRMREETGGSISKVQLPIPDARARDGRPASETVIGMLVRSLATVPGLEQIVLMTSARWEAAHTELARELSARYGVDARCRSDDDHGDEFPPQALANLCEQIGQAIDAGTAPLLVNGDVLIGPQSLQGFLAAAACDLPPIAFGVAADVQYLGLFLISPKLAWRELVRSIGATNLNALVEGIWQRIPVRNVDVAGALYDCGSREGYRKACEAGRLGLLW